MDEISVEHQAELAKRYRTTAIIVSAEIGSTIILLIAGWLFAAQKENRFPPNSLMLLWIAVLLIAVGSFILRRVLNNWERLKATALLKGVSGVLATLQINSIILNSLAEMIAVIGFVIAYLNGVGTDVFRAGAVALIVFLMNFPRKSVWKNITANLEKYERI